MNEHLPLLQHLGAGRRLTADHKEQAEILFEPMFEELAKHRSPPGFRLASGELAKGATGRIALCAYVLLLGRKVRGKDFWRDGRFARWRTHLGYHMMRGAILGYGPPALYCCVPCTLSVFPLFATGVYDDIDGRAQVGIVKDAIENGSWKFSRPYSRKYAEWALSFA